MSVSGFPHVSLLIVETHAPEITAKLLEVMTSHGWAAEQFRNLYYCQSLEKVS